MVPKSIATAHSSTCSGNHMKTVYVSIDDTDNEDSPGSGQLADDLVEGLKHTNLITRSTPVSRHQLHVHNDIPYTSHNSSMCFTALTERDTIATLIHFASNFLVENSAPGSDPGLCVAVSDDTLDCQALIQFGLAAKTTVLSKNDAYSVAEKVGIHLSEHGGGGDGVIGALAAAGLRMHGSDGRFRGWLLAAEPGRIITAGDLCRIDGVEQVVDGTGHVLEDHCCVRISGRKIKTIAKDHRQVIPVTRCLDNTELLWQTLTREESKKI